MSTLSQSLHSFLVRNRQLVLGLQILLVVAIISAGSFQWSAQAHGGDTNLIHSCLSPAGLIRIVDPNYTCLTGETALDWDGRIPQRFQTLGSGLDPVSPAATWIDVPNAAFTHTFSQAAQWKVSYSGMLKLSGGNGTAYIRLQLRPTGGSTSDILTQTIYRFQSPLPDTEASTMPFYVQRLVDVPAGEVTIVPQIYAPGNWSLFGDSTMIIE